MSHRPAGEAVLKETGGNGHDWCVLTDPGLSPDDNRQLRGNMRGLMTALAYRARSKPYSYQSNEDIAERTGLDESSLKKLLKKGELIGWTRCVYSPGGVKDRIGILLLRRIDGHVNPVVANTPEAIAEAQALLEAEYLGYVRRRAKTNMKFRMLLGRLTKAFAKSAESAQSLPTDGVGRHHVHGVGRHHPLKESPSPESGRSLQPLLRGKEGELLRSLTLPDHPDADDEDIVATGPGGASPCVTGRAGEREGPDPQLQAEVANALRRLGDSESSEDEEGSAAELLARSLGHPGGLGYYRRIALEVRQGTRPVDEVITAHGDAMLKLARGLVTTTVAQLFAGIIRDQDAARARRSTHPTLPPYLNDGATIDQVRRHFQDFALCNGKPSETRVKDSAKAIRRAFGFGDHDIFRVEGIAHSRSMTESFRLILADLVERGDRRWRWFSGLFDAAVSEATDEAGNIDRCILGRLILGRCFDTRPGANTQPPPISPPGRRRPPRYAEEPV